MLIIRTSTRDVHRKNAFVSDQGRPHHLIVSSHPRAKSCPGHRMGTHTWTSTALVAPCFPHQVEEYAEMGMEGSDLVEEAPGRRCPVQMSPHCVMTTFRVCNPLRSQTLKHMKICRTSALCRTHIAHKWKGLRNIMLVLVHAFESSIEADVPRHFTKRLASHLVKSERILHFMFLTCLWTLKHARDDVFCCCRPAKSHMRHRCACMSDQPPTSNEQNGR
jgi:hypothetical protein